MGTQQISKYFYVNNNKDQTELQRKTSRAFSQDVQLFEVQNHKNLVATGNPESLSDWISLEPNV